MSETKAKKGSTFSASSLRITLLVMMLLIVVGGVAGIAFGLQTIRSYAVEVSHKKIDAEASNSSLQALQKMQEYLDSNQDVLEKVGLLKSKSEFPEFKVVDEVRQIAAKNDIEIASFSYGSDSSSDATSGGQTTTPSTTGGTGTGTTSAPTAPTTDTKTASGDTISLTVTFSGASYLQYLQFTYDLEQHLPKMKINGIGVSGGSSGSSDSGSGSGSSSSGASVDPLTIEMYIEK